jgi:hypothetical protein
VPMTEPHRVFVVVDRNYGQMAAIETMAERSSSATQRILARPFDATLSPFGSSLSGNTNRKPASHLRKTSNA